MLSKIYKIIILVIAFIVGLFVARKVIAITNMDITITKKAVNKTENGYTITVNMVCKDGITELINQDFTQNHNPNNSFDVAMGALKEQMQKVIDDYKSNQTLLENSDLDTAVADIQISLK